jgi:two-component system, OmpR family, response regulator
VRVLLKTSCQDNSGPSIDTMRILVVEDEPAISDFLERGLKAEGYAVTATGDGARGELLARSGDFDLLILDLMLPGRPGMEILASLRGEGHDIPVILLTAKTDIDSRVAGLDQGATDYVTKPFSFEELAARVRAHLRRPAQGTPTVLNAGGIEMNLLERTVRREDNEIQLSAKEFDLLAYLMRHPGQVLSREQILSGVWGYDYDPGTNIVGVYIAYLRRKLSVNGMDDPIETLRSVGYRLRAGG